MAGPHCGPRTLGPKFPDPRFVQPNRRAIPAPEIAAHLDAYLDHLRETYPERYPRSARDYLEDWAAPNRAYLRKYYPKSGPDAEFDLNPPPRRPSSGYKRWHHNNSSEPSHVS
jgi:hypothetical protein